MEYTRLGSSGLKVSRIALGTMDFGDGKDHRARRALHVSRADLLLIHLRPGRGASAALPATPQRRK
jgi:aryl-alcohol dehydrogenase-like predicted oxidoreductase